MAPKSQSNGTSSKKHPKASAPSSGTATPIPSVTLDSTDFVSYGSGKPDKALYDGEQEKIKTEIDALQAKLNAVKDKIASASGKGTNNERREVLRAELDSIRQAQGNIKEKRSKIFEQLKALQDSLQKKVKDLNAAKAKIPFKTVAEVDDHIRSLEKQVESGSLKLVEEKRALQDISQSKRLRRVVEGFQAEQEAIEKDRAVADELRKQLDNPETKAVSERYDAIKAELDDIKKESDEAYANRSKFMDERSAIQLKLDELFNRKRESAQRFRDAQDRYWNKVNEDRARKAERLRVEKAAMEEAKKREIAERLREEAETPAFQTQIEDCQNLINHFSGKSSTPTPLSNEKSKASIAGVEELSIRKVEDVPAGVIVRKKKGEEEDNYFVGGAGKKKGGKKGGNKVATHEADAESPSNDRLNIPMSYLSALLSFSIPPPTSQSEVPRVIEDLKTKKAWFEANQSRVTAENIAKAEAEIQSLIGKSGSVSRPTATDIAPPNGGAEKPAEPAHTPAVGDELSLPVPDEEVKEKLESIQEGEANDD